jgi:CMP-N-acetylneuraminic acid synthetase
LRLAESLQTQASEYPYLDLRSKVLCNVMTCVGGIFARGGSKGIPGKNLRMVGGKSLLKLAIERAQGVPELDYIFVSTDSVAICHEAQIHGAEVPFMRPDGLSADDAPEWSAWQHALGFLDNHLEQMPDVFVAVPTTSPLSCSEDVRRCLVAVLDSNWDAVVTVTPARRTPDFNMVTIGESGRVRLLNDTGQNTARRQDAQPAFDLCTVAYAIRASFLRTATRLFDGRVGAVIVPPERALDIDSPFDLTVADLVLQHRREDPMSGCIENCDERGTPC